MATYQTDDGEWEMGDTRVDKTRRMVYNENMPKNEFTTMRIWKATRKMIRILAANNEESMISLVDRLVKEELERVKSTTGATNE